MICCPRRDESWERRLQLVKEVSLLEEGESAQPAFDPDISSTYGSSCSTYVELQPPITSHDAMFDPNKLPSLASSRQSQVVTNDQIDKHVGHIR